MEREERREFRGDKVHTQRKKRIRKKDTTLRRTRKREQGDEIMNGEIEFRNRQDEENGTREQFYKNTQGSHNKKTTARTGKTTQPPTFLQVLEEQLKRNLLGLAHAKNLRGQRESRAHGLYSRR